MKQLAKYNIQIAALCETGIYDSSVKIVCLNRAVTTARKNSGSEWEPVSERNLRITIHCSPISVTVIAVYAPVNPSSKSMGDDSDKFYAHL